MLSKSLPLLLWKDFLHVFLYGTLFKKQLFYTIIPFTSEEALRVVKGRTEGLEICNKGRQEQRVQYVWCVHPSMSFLLSSFFESCFPSDEALGKV